MPKQNYSPDFLELNPDLAARLTKSRAKTPDGEGRYGHVPDAQRYKQAIPLRLRVQVALLSVQAITTDPVAAEFAQMWPADAWRLAEMERHAEALSALVERVEREETEWTS